MEWLRDKVAGRVPIVAKGILHPQDALEAVRCGAKGIVVSNHGGRQVDGSVPAIDAVREYDVVIKCAG